MIGSKRIGIFMLNALLVVLYLIGLLFIELLLFGKILSVSKSMDWSIWMDVLIYTISFAILAIHYVVTYLGQRKKLISEVSVKILAVIEMILAFLVIYLFGSGVIQFTYEETVFYFVMQLLIVFARMLYFKFCSSRIT